MTATIKTDFPPFRMTIENGHLVPATPFDAERLDTFSGKKQVLCYFTQEPNRVLQRKWYAVIGKAVTECKTPWRNVNQASDALKIALGHNSPYKTVDGEWRATPRSLNELTDSQMGELFDGAMALLERITGVDPLTLLAEATRSDRPDDYSAGVPRDHAPDNKRPEQETEIPAGDKPAGSEGGDEPPAQTMSSPSQESEAVSSSHGDGSGESPKGGGGSNPPPPPPQDSNSAGDVPLQDPADAGADSAPKEAGSTPQGPASEGDEEYTVVHYAKLLLRTASVMMTDPKFKSKNEDDARQAVKITASCEQPNLGKMDKATKETVKFVHEVITAVLQGHREIGNARNAIAARLECDPDELVMEDE